MYMNYVNNDIYDNDLRETARESKEGQEEAEDRGQHASSLTTLQVVDLGGVVMSPYYKYDSVPRDNVCSYARAYAHAHDNVTVV